MFTKNKAPDFKAALWAETLNAWESELNEACKYFLFAQSLSLHVFGFRNYNRGPISGTMIVCASEPCHMCHMIIINSLAPLPDQPLTPPDPEEIDSASENQTSAQVSEERGKGERKKSKFSFCSKTKSATLLPATYIGSKFLRQHPNWKESSNNRVGMLNNFVDHTHNTFTEEMHRKPWLTIDFNRVWC